MLGCNKVSTSFSSSDSDSYVKISISRIELDIKVQEVFGSSVSVRISDLVESDASVFKFSDKEEDLVENKFAVFTA